MKKRTTVYEDRDRKQREYVEKHTAVCPHCGAKVLDHMTKCPSCGGELTPSGYQPLSEKKIKKIKLITFLIGMAIAVVVVYFLVFYRK